MLEVFHRKIDLSVSSIVSVICATFSCVCSYVAKNCPVSCLCAMSSEISCICMSPGTVFMSLLTHHLGTLYAVLTQ